MGTYTLTTWLSDRRGADTLLECLQGICKFKINMLGVSREQYDWQRGECVYLEDNMWHVELNMQENGESQPVSGSVAADDRI